MENDSRLEGTNSRQTSSEVLEEHHLKILVVGNAFAGKTSFIARYAEGVFHEECKPTIGADYVAKRLIRDDGRTVVNLQLWDVSGQERYINITRAFYSQSNAVVVMVDLTDKNGLQAAKMWKDDVDSKVSAPNGAKIPAILVANKCDLADHIKLDDEELDRAAIENGYIGWFKVSAKENLRLAEAIDCLVDATLKQPLPPALPDSERNSFKLEENEKPKTTSRWCPC